MKFSIIMPSLNQRAYLSKAIDSVLSQQGNFDLELIIMDGGSTDGSLELLQSITDPRVQVCSGKDKGQSDAINQGFAKATGDIHAWLNSDDFYLPGAFQAVVDTSGNQPKCQWCIGRVIIVNANDQPIRPGITRYKNRKLDRFTNHTLLIENPISQMGVFWRRELADNVAYSPQRLLNEDLYYTMDYDLWLRFMQISHPVIMDDDVAAFRWYPQSKTGRINRAQFDEQFAVAKPYLTDKPWLRFRHRLGVEMIVFAYRLLRLLGR